MHPSFLISKFIFFVNDDDIISEMLGLGFCLKDGGILRVILLVQ